MATSEQIRQLMDFFLREEEAKAQLNAIQSEFAQWARKLLDNSDFQTVGEWWGREAKPTLADALDPRWQHLIERLEKRLNEHIALPGDDTQESS